MAYQRCVLIGRSYASVLLYSSSFQQVSRSCRVGTIKLHNTFHTSAWVMKRRKTSEERKSDRIIEYSPKAKGEMLEVWHRMTLGDLARVLNKDMRYVGDIFLNELKGANTVIEDMKQLQGAIKRSGNRMRIVGKPMDENEVVKDKDVYRRDPAKKEELVKRPPVVTVMGHVDHGKTTLLDALRNTSVVDQEFGGITQHIGAFSVGLRGGKGKVTFLDTPGHAAFTAMRERGANLTDIVVLVVAADDGVMEQTIESVKMARKANVPILVAINKIDAPKADVQRTEEMLVQVGIQVEKMGGDVQAVPISALKRQNLEQLTEALALQAELMDIGADPTGMVEAVVVESKVHTHRGRLCTLVVQRGTLKKGDILVAGTAMCRVRTLRDAEGNLLDKAPPGTPAEIEGWKDLPSAGEQVLQVETEKKARTVLDFRAQKKMMEKQTEDAPIIAAKEEQHNREYQERLTLKRSLGRYRLKPTGPRTKEIQNDNNGKPKLNLIVKADVDGTLEALLDTLDTYDSPHCELDLVHYAVGTITESDLELAQTFNALIYAFNVSTSKKIENLADETNVTIKHHNVIYKLVDDLKEEINVKLPSKEVEEVLGSATVLQQFDINDGRRKIPVAGARCTQGTLKRHARYKLVRKEETIYDGTLSSMRHLKNEVDVVKKDLECGVQLADKSVGYEVGDTLVCYEIRSVPQKTDWDPGF